MDKENQLIILPINSRIGTSRFQKLVGIINSEFNSKYSNIHVASGIFISPEDHPYLFSKLENNLYGLYISSIPFEKNIFEYLADNYTDDVLAITDLPLTIGYGETRNGRTNLLNRKAIISSVLFKDNDSEKIVSRLSLIGLHEVCGLVDHCAEKLPNGKHCAMVSVGILDDLYDISLDGLEQYDYRYTKFCNSCKTLLKYEHYFY